MKYTLIMTSKYRTYETEISVTADNETKAIEKAKTLGGGNWAYKKHSIGLLEDAV